MDLTGILMAILTIPIHTRTVIHPIYGGLVYGGLGSGSDSALVTDILTGADSTPMDP